MKDKEVTNDELARMIAEGFSNTASKYDLNMLAAKVDKIDKKVNELDIKVNELDIRVSNLPTKSYLDDKFADLEGDLIKKLRKEDEKLNRLAQILKQKAILTDGDIAELGYFEVFPKSPSEI